MDSITVDPHIRAIDIRKDLSAIADLIELAFSDHMDDEGRDYLRHIRLIVRGFGRYLIDGNTPETSQFPFHGYVWEENNRIIGNLTLIPVRRLQPGHYFIANVAVHPDQRGRGIGRLLTDRAIAHVRDHHGKQIFLQVREDNPTALHIYLDTGFEEFSRRTSWIVSQNRQKIPKNTAVMISRRRPADWQHQKHWLQEIYPESITWNLPFSTSRLQPGFITLLNNFLNGGTCSSWTAWTGNQLLGIAAFERGFALNDNIWLAASPATEDTAVRSLIPFIISRSFYPRKILLNYPSGRAIGSLTESGMQPLHTLIWMKKNMVYL